MQKEAEEILLLDLRLDTSYVEYSSERTGKLR
jgi:hypothetical protein